MTLAAELVNLAQASPSAEAYERAALEWLGRRVGFDAAFFMTKGQTDSITTLGLDEKTRARLLSGRAAIYAEELMPVQQAACAARGVAVDTAVCGVDRVQKTAYYREIAAKVRGRHGLLGYVPWGGRTAAVVMLGRTGSTFSEHDVRLVESVLPALGVARAAFGLAWSSPPLSAGTRYPKLAWPGFGNRARTLACVRSRNGALVVRDRGGFREMVAESQGSELVWTRARLKEPGKSGWPYVELFHLAAALARRRGRALFVGSGGAVSLRQFASVYPGITIDLVERDPAVIALARSWFDLDAIPGVTVHIDDGGRFLREAASSSWDVVVIDAYADSRAFAEEFTRRDCLSALRRALNSGGAVAWNVIGALSGDGPVSRLVSAAGAVFEAIRVVPVLESVEADLGAALRNVVVIATRGD